MYKRRCIQNGAAAHSYPWKKFTHKKKRYSLGMSCFRSALELHWNEYNRRRNIIFLFFSPAINRTIHRATEEYLQRWSSTAGWRWFNLSFLQITMSGRRPATLCLATCSTTVERFRVARTAGTQTCPENQTVASETTYLPSFFLPLPVILIYSDSIESRG